LKSDTLLHYQFFNKLKEFSFVEEIWLFGSRARGDHQKRADIDIAIACSHASEKDWLSVLEIIEEADTLLSIDCLRLDTLDDASDIKKAIFTQGRLLYERNKN
jgi:predicted nucleotidyltransferase